MNFDWSSLFLFSGLTSCIAGSVVSYLVFKENRRMYFFILVLLISISVILTERIVRFSNLYFDYPELLFISGPFIFFIYPFTYIFQSLMVRKHSYWYYHLIIPVLSLFVLPAYLMDSSAKLAMYSEGLDDPWWFTTFFASYSITYIIMIFLNSRKNLEYLRSLYSDSRIENHLVINRFISMCGLLYLCLPIAFSIVYLDIDNEIEKFFRKILFTVFSFAPSLLYLSFFMPNESLLIEGKYQQDEDTVPHSKHSLKWEELTRFMEGHQPYLNQHLTLDDLAKKTEMGRTELSKLINTHFENNFYDFINSYRIEYFIERLHKGDHERFSLEALAIESGFKSYTSFYRVFKRKQGISPSIFIERLEK